MAKIANEKTPQVKSRKTKLGKKSVEELIDIILRKDKIEKNLNSQVASLKGEVNSLTSRVNNFDKDMAGTLTELANLRDTNKTNRESIDSLKVRLKDKQSDYEKLNKYYVELENKCSIYKNICWVEGIIIAAITFCLICF